MKKIAILGATIAQQPLYIKARKLGLYIVGISQKEGAICSELADVFYPVSLSQMDDVVEICRKENVNGVVSNCSEFSVKIVAYVAEKLDLDGTPYDTIIKIQDKDYTRNISNQIDGFSNVRSFVYEGKDTEFYPCVVKPIPSCAKKGLSIAYDKQSFKIAIDYANEYNPSKILVEEFIDGMEVSVETISCRGNHYVIQITDKETSGAPHFVELSHHQPSLLPIEVKNKIKNKLPLLLDKIGFVTGAAHTELKIDSNGNLYLIEVNPRGGGDEISNKLVELSTGYDYIASMIKAALGELEEPKVKDFKYSGIYFLTKQTENRLPFFLNAINQPWFIDGKVESFVLNECVSNNYKDGFVIYQSDSKVFSDNYSVVLLNGISNAFDLLYRFHEETGQYTEDGKNEETINRFLRYGYVIGCIRNGRIVAMINLYCNRDETAVAYINNVYVMQEYRKKGLAKLMLEYAFNIVKNKKVYKEIHLHVYKDNVNAIRLYSTLGFSLHHEDDEEKIEMVKFV